MATDNQYEVALMNTLRVKVLTNCPNRDKIVEYYTKWRPFYVGDCGVDLMFPRDTACEVNTVTKCSMGIACEFIPKGSSVPGSYFLMPRNATNDLPVVTSACVIDASYRGPIIAAVRCFPDKSLCQMDFPGNSISLKRWRREYAYNVRTGTRLVQIVAPNMEEIRVQVVDSLSSTTLGWLQGNNASVKSKL